MLDKLKENNHNLISSTTVALFVNYLNIDTNSVTSDELEGYLNIMKVIKDKKSTDDVLDSFLCSEKETGGKFSFFCFGEIKNHENKTSHKDIYNMIVEEIQSINNKNVEGDILSIGFPIDKGELNLDLNKIGFNPVLNNGDIFYIDGIFYFCIDNQFIELKDERLTNFID